MNPTRVALVALLLSFWTAETRAQEVLVEADASAHPPDTRVRRVHGDIRFGAGFGFIVEDPIASLEPSFGLDLRDVAPIELRLGAPVRLRMYDRDPEQGQVVRNTDWDEVGDYLAILQQLSYTDDYVFAEQGRAMIDLRVGNLGRVHVGHGSIVHGYANSLDLDRRRTGVDLDARVEGALLEQPAGAELAFVVGDLAGQQLFGTRVGADWAGAGIGFSVFGDPLAPRTLVPYAPGSPAIAVDSQNRLSSSGSRGATALGLDFSYRWTDRWRYLVVPYIDLNLMPGLGKGMHIGVDTEFTLGRRRAARIGVVGELTVGDAGYDPTYFDVFYMAQRMQGQFVAYPGDLPTGFGGAAAPKYGFVQQSDLHGVGGYGALRFSHEEGAFIETGYRYRPGPLGHTWETRIGVDLEVVQLSVLAAHKGPFGFNIVDPAGTLGRLDLNVPVNPYLDVTAQAGWQPVVRRAPGEPATARQPSGGFVGGGGLILFGIAGRFGW